MRIQGVRRIFSFTFSLPKIPTVYDMKKVLRTCLTVLPVLLGFALAPFVHLWTFDHVSVFTMWQYGEKPISNVQFFASLGSLLFGVAWSVFAIFGWKRGDIGVRVGVTVIVWSLATGVISAYLARCLLEAV